MPYYFRRAMAAVVLGLLLLPPARAELLTLEEAIQLNVQLQGPNIHFSIQNVSKFDIEVFDGFDRPYSPYGWPDGAWIQFRDSEGGILTFGDEGQQYDLWNPWVYVSQATLLPVELDLLRAGTTWEADVDLEDILTGAASAHIGWNTGADPFDEGGRAAKVDRVVRSIESVKIFFRAMVGPMLSEHVPMETDWLQLRPGGWFIPVDTKQEFQSPTRHPNHSQITARR